MLWWKFTYIKLINYKKKSIQDKYPNTKINNFEQPSAILSKFDYLKIIVELFEKDNNKPSENDKILLMNGDDMIIKYDPDFDNHDFIAGYNFISNVIIDNETDKMNIEELIASINIRMRNWDKIIDYGGSIMPYWFIKNYLFETLENERLLSINYPFQSRKKLFVCEKIDFLRQLRHQDLFIPNEPFIFHRLWEAIDIL